MKPTYTNKSVSAYCKHYFTNEKNDDYSEFITGWTKIVNAWTVIAYIKAVKQFKYRWLYTYLEDVAYIKSNWLVL